MIELRRTFVAALGLTLTVLALLTACDLNASAPEATPSAVASTVAIASVPASTPTSAPPTPEPTESVPQGGALTIRLPTDVAELKPWDLRSRGEEYVADLMYNGLTRLDAQLVPQPDLADDWSVSPDGTVITFTLRSDVTWHDGAPLTAEDVVWTLSTLRTITPTNALLFDLGSTIEDVRSTAQQAVVVTLQRPYAPLLAELAVPILPRHKLQNRSPEELATLNFWDEPIGTGPFKYARRQPNQSIAFTRNEAYFRGAPNLDQVALIVAPDPAVATTAVEEQQLLLAEFPAATEPLSSPLVLDTVETGAYQENGWYAVAFNTRPERLFADGRLREALARAVDVEAVVAAVTEGGGLPIATTLSTASGMYPDAVGIAAADVDAARALLDEAGWVPGPEGVRQKEGRLLSARLWVRGDDPRRVAAAQRIAEAAQQVGMQLEVVPANFNTVMLAKLAPPYDFDLLLGSWVHAPNSASFPTNRFYDPDDYALLHSSRVWGGQGDTRTGLRNITGFRNPEYDAAADAARSTYDPASRKEAMQAAQGVLARERPYLFLWADRIVVVLNERVATEEGTITLDTPRFLWNVEQWYLTP